MFFIRIDTEENIVSKFYRNILIFENTIIVIICMKYIDIVLLQRFPKVRIGVMADSSLLH